MGEGGLDDEPVEVLDDVVPLFLLAAPPHRDAGDLQLLAQQMAAQHGQERLERQQLDKPAAERVRNRNGTRAHRLDQPGDAERAVDAKLQRVAVIVIQAAQDDMDRLQPAQRLQEDVPVAHRQVAALDQRDAEMAGEIGVLEIGLVIGAGSQQDDPGIGSLLRRQTDQHLAERGEEGGQRLDVAVLEGVGQNPADHRPVFQRVAGPARRLRPVAQHPPAPIG